MKPTLKEYMEQAVLDRDKTKKVILSCRNKEQLKCAWKYFQLWQQKYNYFLNVQKSRDFLYIEGLLTGLFHAILKDELYGQRTIPQL